MLKFRDAKGRKCAFIHVPKNGGSFVRLSVFKDGVFDSIDLSPKRGINKGHLPYSMLKEDELFNDVERWIAIVRNPWDRTVSRYFWAKTKGRNTEYLVEGMNFKRWVERKYEHPKVRDTWNPMSWRQQVEWLGDEVEVYRMEDYGHLGYLFEEILDCSLNTKKVQQSKRSRDYTEYYDKKTSDLVRRYYADDIERFGYEYAGND